MAQITNVFEQARCLEVLTKYQHSWKHESSTLPKSTVGENTNRSRSEKETNALGGDQAKSLGFCANNARVGEEARHSLGEHRWLTVTSSAKSDLA